MFFAQPENARKLAAEFPDADYNALDGAADFAASLAGASKISSADAAVCVDEVALACRMMKWAFNRARGDFVVETVGQQTELKFISAEFERVWLERARLGGLAESAGKIRAVRPELFETAFFQ